jgi:hypothetical protein
LERRDMATNILRQRDILLERVHALATSLDVELAPTCEQLSSGVRQLNGKWQALTDFHNNARKFSHLLSWQSWYDRQTNGGTYWTSGHDVRISLTQKYLSRQIKNSNIFKNIDWGDLNITIRLDEAPLVTFPATLADSIQITFSGEITKDLLVTTFVYRFHIGIFPAARKSERVRIIKAGTLTLGDAVGIDRATLQRDINARLQKYFLEQGLFDFDKLTATNLNVHSAHIDKHLSLFFSASLPKVPLRELIGDVEELPAPDAWEEMLLMVNDGYISRTMSQNLDGFGSFAYKADPFNPGNFAFPFVTRVTVVRDSHVNLWFVNFKWHYENTVWPEFWLRMKSNLRNDGKLNVLYQVSLAGSDKVEAESSVFSLSDVERVEAKTFKQKGFHFAFCFKQ